MWSTLSLVVGALVVAASAALAESPDDAPPPRRATVTRVDVEHNSITLKTTDADGKVVERTFALTPDIQVYQGKARVTKTDVFKVGRVILAVERQGKITELRLPDEVAAPAGNRATITAVDPKRNTISLLLRDAEGNEVERTFAVSGGVGLYDEGGKVAQLGSFKVGRIILATERGGRLIDLRLPGSPERPGEVPPDRK